MKLVIVGNGAAAYKALKAIAVNRNSLEEKVEATIISSEKTTAYAPMYLLGYLSGELGEEEIRLRDRDGISVERWLGKKVVAVEDSLSRVILQSGEEVSYDKLLIASGASAVKPSIKGIDKYGVHYFNRLEDAKKLAEDILSARQIIVIGAGAVGVEVANALRKMGKGVRMVERFDQILPQMLDRDLASYLAHRLRASGIDIMLGKRVSEIMGNGQATGIVLGEEIIEGDLILVTVGVEPNIDLVENSHVRVSKGILVDEKMQTNAPNIYAAGDVAESIDPYGGYEVLFNWYNAIHQGWIAGCNMVGLELTYRASPALAVLKGIEPHVIAIGRKYALDGYEILTRTVEKKGVYERIYLKDNRIDAYQAIGVPDKTGLMYGYIRERRDVRGIKEFLCEDHIPPRLAH